MAQLGRALRSGRRGRKFESCRIDAKRVFMGYPLFSLLSIKSFREEARNGGTVPKEQKALETFESLMKNWIDMKAVQQQWASSTLVNARTICNYYIILSVR